MALNIKRLENLPHPTEQVSDDQVPVEEPGRGAEGSKNYEESINDSKRFSLVRGYVEAIYEKRKNAKSKLKDKRKTFADAIKRLNIL